MPEAIQENRETQEAPEIIGVKRFIGEKELQKAIKRERRAQKFQNNPIIKGFNAIREKISSALDPIITPLKRKAIPLTLTLGLVAGCGMKGKNMDATGNPRNTGSLTLPMTSEDLQHLRNQTEAPTVGSAPKNPNPGEFNSEPVFTYTENGNCYAKRGTDELNALQNPDSQVINLPGHSIACIIFNNKIYFATDSVKAADLIDNGGTLEAQNIQDLPNWPGGSSLSLVIENGTPFLLLRDPMDRVVKHNLTTNAQTTTGVSAKCGVPHNDPNTDVWIGGYYSSSWTPNCRLIRATSLNGLISSLHFIPGITGEAREPRIWGNILIWEGTDGIYYALVDEYCGDSDCNGTETHATCPGDCPQIPDDGGVEPPDGGPEDDGGVEPPDGGEAPDGGDVDDGGVEPPDGGGAPDGGEAPDGGDVDDGGVPEDDGGVQPPDGGIPGPDGGSRPDGGTPGPDGGLPGPDGGAGPDGGPIPDGGVQLPDGGNGIEPSPSCCNVAGERPSGSAVPGAILLAGMLALFRRRSRKITDKEDI